MKVWRYEKNGVGPYSGDNMFHPAHTRNPRTPGWNTDFSHSTDPRDVSGYVSGFSSLAQARKWFTLPERKEMVDLGYKLELFEVASEFVIHGRKQVAFRRDKAEKRKHSRKD